jgi:hypothetical protein
LYMEKNRLEKLKEIYAKISTPEERLIDLMELFEDGTFKGEPGHTPTEKELMDLIRPMIPTSIDGEDGHTPTVPELEAIIKPLIPAPLPGVPGKPGKPGNNGSPDTAYQLIEKIKSAKGKKRLSIYDLKDIEHFQRERQSIQWAPANGGAQGTGGVTLTTNGSGGAATLVGSVLNIPIYTAGGAYTAGAGLTLTTNQFSVNTTQNITTLSNLGAGIVQSTSGGVLSSAPLTSGQVTTALGFTPYNSSNPSGYTSNVTGQITAGTNVTITGSGTTGSPYVVNAASGLTNPMTSVGDMIIGGASGTPTRLPAGTNTYVLSMVSGSPAWVAATGGGTVTSASVVSANGFAGTVATATSTPAITITTTVTGILKGNGTAISAATAGTDYQVPLTFSTGLTNASNTVTVNTTQNITTLSNLTVAGFVQTTSGGVLSSALLTSGQVTTALGFTPYNSTNPSGYTNNTGTVTTISVATANGFAGTVATATTTPVVTITTSITGLLKGNGTAISAATAGTDYTTPTDTETMTNKRITKRVLALSANSAAPAINTDSYDVVHITGQTATITGFTMSGTPVDGDTLRISITGTASVPFTPGTSFENSGTVTMPTTTTGTTRLDLAYAWNTETSKWRAQGYS